MPGDSAHEYSIMSRRCSHARIAGQNQTESDRKVLFSTRADQRYRFPDHLSVARQRTGHLLNCDDCKGAYQVQRLDARVLTDDQTAKWSE